MRREYEMTSEDLAELLAACRPTPVMFLSGGQPMFDSPQANANRAWEALGRKLGFMPTTVQPVRGKGKQFFTAEPLLNAEPSDGGKG